VESKKAEKKKKEAEVKDMTFTDTTTPGEKKGNSVNVPMLK